jgi:hypothetical protein
MAADSQSRKSPSTRVGAFALGIDGQVFGGAELTFEQIPSADFHLEAPVREGGQDLTAIGGAGNSMQDHGKRPGDVEDIPWTSRTVERMRPLE